jgi:hypothetical protein
MSTLRDPGNPRFATANFWGILPRTAGDLPATLPPLPNALGDECLGRWRLEIRPLPALLSPGSDHLERAVLPSSLFDALSVANRRDALSLRPMPLQFCEFPAVPGKDVVEKNAARDGGRR